MRRFFIKFPQSFPVGPLPFKEECGKIFQIKSQFRPLVAPLSLSMKAFPERENALTVLSEEDSLLDD